MEGWDVELIVTMNPRIGYMERDGFDSGKFDLYLKIHDNVLSEEMGEWLKTNEKCSEEDIQLFKDLMKVCGSFSPTIGELMTEHPSGCQLSDQWILQRFIYKPEVKTSESSKATTHLHPAYPHQEWNLVRHFIISLHEDINSKIGRLYFIIKKVN